MSCDAVRFVRVTKSFDAKATAIFRISDALARLKNGQLRRPLLETPTRRVLDDVTFDVAPGERLGILGGNGAGKSTILKLINGTMRPTSGDVTVAGSIGGLIELSAGFQGDLTGLDNVKFKLAFYGYSGREALAAAPGVFRLAGLENFAQTPFKFYSSGMKVRLGFAVALAVSPDIVLLDEVLAVGDMAFRQRSMELVEEYLRDRTVLFVSHNMTDVRRVCSRVLVLDKHRVVFDGPTAEGIRAHESLLRVGEAVAEREILAGSVLRGRADAPSVEIRDLTLSTPAGESCQVFEKGERIRLAVEVASLAAGGVVDLKVRFRKRLVGNSSEIIASQQLSVPMTAGSGGVALSIATTALLSGDYILEILAGLAGQPKTASMVVRRQEFRIFSTRPVLSAGLVDLDLREEGSLQSLPDSAAGQVTVQGGESFHL